MGIHQPSNNNEWSETKRGGTGLRFWKWVLILFCFACGAALGIALYTAKSLQPAESTGQAVQVTIPSGVGSAKIAAILEQKGIIRNARIFSYYLKYKKQGDKFQAGEYSLAPGMTLDQIIDVLNKGETLKPEMMRFTIPEGFTIEQIAEKLAQQGDVDFDGFLAEADHYTEAKAGAASQIPQDQELRHPLEGYLFPETYELKKGSTTADIIEVMLEELDKKLDTLPEGWRTQLSKQGLTLHQMLTVASLIEREVVLEEERPVVASVIYNRLKRGQPLQIDATVQYLLDKPKEHLLEKDLRVESPYNTYLHDGLPPGPIASPSLSSIKAALYPADTNYYYYVTKKDGSQGHLFAETFEQHRRNIEESAKQHP